jgi:hypothetical protein
MCVWDGTYTAPEAEREAMDQVPGWNDDEAPIPDRCQASAARLGFARAPRIVLYHALSQGRRAA